jgi:hypothetical protein
MGAYRAGGASGATGYSRGVEILGWPGFSFFWAERNATRKGLTGEAVNGRGEE